jgi:hypothetical protein
MPSLRPLLSGHPVRLADAATAIGPELEQVAKILTEEQLCTTLTPALSSGYTDLVTNATC